ncbi:hypothetical protein FJ978_14270 [Mesorhizobium sp. B1-1-7]|nr:hypothetical protein FJ978_14270 [Mesorhizobium sp. B1-1-7]
MPFEVLLACRDRIDWVALFALLMPTNGRAEATLICRANYTSMNAPISYLADERWADASKPRRFFSADARRRG